jgi:hypothetical protein
VPAGSTILPGTIEAGAVVPANGQYLLQPSAKFNVDGVYGLVVQVRDGSGDMISSAPLTLTISTSGPKIPPTLDLVGASDPTRNSIVPAANPALPANPRVTVVRRPFVTGVTDPGATVTIFTLVNGRPMALAPPVTASQFKNGSIPAGTYTVQLLSNLVDGTIQIFAQATNAAGNTNPTATELTIKVTTSPGDYTGVGTAGLALYSPGTGNFMFTHAGTTAVTTLPAFGLANVDVPVSGDFNGDGQTDPAVYRPTDGSWIIDVNSQATGQFIDRVPTEVAPGPNVTPAQGDFDADGLTDPAVYDLVGGTGYFVIDHNSVASGSTATVTSVAWGMTGDVPVPGDYAGLGSAQVAVFRPSNGTWYDPNTAAVVVTPPAAGDVPVPADYDEVYRAEQAIFRPSNETFYIHNSLTGGGARTVTMPKLAGQGPNDVIIPAPADYTGDGKADPAIYDQTLGMYEYVSSATGTAVVRSFSATNRDIPPNSPYQYRAAANTGAPSFTTAGGFIRGGSGGAAAPALAAAGGSSGSSGGFATAAVVIGSPVPTGSTSTGKSSTLPTGTVLKAPPIVLATSSASSSRPAQSDATDSAIASLGKSYNGLFI